MKTEKPRILVALDFSAQARKALDWALLHAVATHGEVHVVHVVEYKLADVLPAADKRLEREIDQLKTEAQLELERMVPAAQRADLPPYTRHIAMGSPAAEILTVAESIKADVIVMGSHGRSGMGRFLLGSVAEKVMRHARGVVVCVKPE